MNLEQEKFDINNPHDSLFRFVLKIKENALSCIEGHIPSHLLEIMELETLEICKDSFIDSKLKDYFSDILYKVNLKDETPAYIYLLFKHKIYYNKYINLKLLKNIIKIKKIFLKKKKKKKKKDKLPIVLPLVIYHGSDNWQKSRLSLSSLLSGPVDKFSEYIPDFKINLIDLTAIPDEEIKGTIVYKVMQLLFKHINHINNEQDWDKLESILYLLRDLPSKETGLD